MYILSRSEEFSESDLVKLKVSKKILSYKPEININYKKLKF